MASTSTTEEDHPPNRPPLTGLALFETLDRVIYPSLNPALVLGHDISHFSDSLMYGELSPQTLSTAFTLIQDTLGGLPPPGQGSLIDIGAGIGKQIFCAACLYQWKRVSGVEIYEKRAKMAALAVQRWEEIVIGTGTYEGQEEEEEEEEEEGNEGEERDEQKEREGVSLPLSVPPPPTKKQKWHKGYDLPPTSLIDFTCGDIVELGAEGYDVILLVSAAFTDSLMKIIAQVLEDAPVGTFAICITKGLPCAKWEVVYKGEREEPWGRAWLIIQRKVE